MRVPSFIRALLAVTVALVMAMPAHADGVTGQGNWESTLLGRDINLNAVAAISAIAVYLYDTTLNVNWLCNANVNDQMDWTTATNWVANLSTGSGATANCGCNGNATSSSEMAHLFFSTLGNKSYFDTNGNVQSGYGLTNSGSFQNLQSYVYWSGSVCAPSVDRAWAFRTDYGLQPADDKGNQFYAMAVRPGDFMASVPEPTYAMSLA